MAEARLEDALMEMHWGDWEGRRLDALRAEDGTLMAMEEARGHCQLNGGG